MIPLQNSEQGSDFPTYKEGRKYGQLFALVLSFGTAWEPALGPSFIGQSGDGSVVGFYDLRGPFQH